ncbi:MAG TPA: hypothetical protein VFY71_17165 [Planctomycetota bacterium]|nr:hypothetical protein [Planctomycetota bacterium]
MPEAGAPALPEWESFYVIVGSSAAALTGLMFVVITLVAERRGPQTGRAIGAFASPTVVHFCAALLVSAVLSAPWRSVATAADVVGVMGLLGVGYAAIVVRRARAVSVYRAVLEDWVWHALLPLVAYVDFAIAGLCLEGFSAGAQFAIAGGTVLLLLCGIHNAWDAVTYNALQSGETASRDDPPP